MTTQQAMHALLFAIGPITARGFADHVSRCRQADKESVKDLPHVADIATYLGDMGSVGLANELPNGEWEAVPEKPAEQKPRDKQKGLFDD